jgi:hypothetical protein
MFYAGGGPGFILPAGPFGLHIFLMTRFGYKMSKDMTLNLSVKVPMYFNGKIEGLSASVMYGFMF